MNDAHLTELPLLDGTTTAIDESVARVWSSLREIADSLYGTDSDLWALTRLPDRHPQAAATRQLLRWWFRLVQDPVTGTWLWMGERRRSLPSHETIGTVTVAEECGRHEQSAEQP